MGTLIETVSVIGPVVGAVMILTLFFKLLGWIGRRSSGGVQRIGLKGVLDAKTFANVCLSNGTILENVRLIGFTDTRSMKTPLPFELNGMAVLEHTDGRRSIVSAKLIRMIEVPQGAFHGV